MTPEEQPLAPISIEELIEIRDQAICNFYTKETVLRLVVEIFNIKNWAKEMERDAWEEYQDVKLVGGPICYAAGYELGRRQAAIDLVAGEYNDT